jgi:DNA-binding NarL/FixJ family response regulator
MAHLISTSPPTSLRPLVDALLRQAAERDAAAEERDGRAAMVSEALAADPDAYSAAEVQAMAAADRAAAAADREAAAADRASFVQLLDGGCGSTSSAPPAPPEGLTVREAQVLDRLARAMSTKAIADDLYLSPNSVKTHTQSLYRKIGVRTRAEAALWARDHGIG